MVSTHALPLCLPMHKALVRLLVAPGVASREGFPECETRILPNPFPAAAFTQGSPQLSRAGVEQSVFQIINVQESSEDKLKVQGLLLESRPVENRRLWVAFLVCSAHFRASVFISFVPV